MNALDIEYALNFKWIGHSKGFDAERLSWVFESRVSSYEMPVWMAAALTAQLLPLDP
jgi:hypothetical protein